MARVAVLSVYDKSGLDELAEGLQQAGYTLVATPGTAEVLREWGYEPEFLSNYVKASEREEAAQIMAGQFSRKSQDCPEILVCNFRPIRVVDDTVVGDHGGQAMVRAAAMHGLLVLTDPSDYAMAIPRLGKISIDLRNGMRWKALDAVRTYESALTGRRLLAPR